MDFINVERLDEGYDTTVRLYNCQEQEGRQVLAEIEALIARLREHWVGTDATAQINALIAAHDALQDFLKKSEASTVEAMKNIVKVQEVRSANGGNGQVGDIKKVNEEVTKLEEVPDTEKYYIDPAARKDYNDLVGIGEKLTAFYNSFKSTRDQLMTNWTSGSNRSDTQAAFDEIDDINDKFTKALNETTEKLNTAVTNAEKIMEA